MVGGGSAAPVLPREGPRGAVLGSRSWARRCRGAAEGLGWGVLGGESSRGGAGERSWLCSGSQRSVATGETLSVSTRLSPRDPPSARVGGTQPPRECRSRARGPELEPGASTPQPGHPLYLGRAGSRRRAARGALRRRGDTASSRSSPPRAGGQGRRGGVSHRHCHPLPGPQGHPTGTHLTWQVQRVQGCPSGVKVWPLTTFLPW